MKRFIRSSSHQINADKRLSSTSERYKGYRISLLNDGSGYAVFDKHGEMEDHGFKSTRDAKLFVDGLIMEDIHSSKDPSEYEYRKRLYEKRKKEFEEYGEDGNNDLLTREEKMYIAKRQMEEVDSSCSIVGYCENCEWTELASKQVPDSDGFLTDYTLYTDGVNFICMFGDTDLYEPSYDYADFDTVDEEEAWEWFNNYTGFEDDDIYGATSNTSDAKDLKFDEEWDNKFGEPSTEVFTRDEFFNWMNEVISFESSK